MKPKEIIHLLSQASAQLGPCGNEACKFFIKLAQEALEQQDMPEYGAVINNLFEFFDGNTTYTSLIEQMNSAQTEVSRMSQQLFRRREEDDPTDIAQAEDCTEFFTTMNMMLWILKPIGRDAERKYEDRCRTIAERKEREEAEKKGEK